MHGDFCRGRTARRVFVAAPLLFAVGHGTAAATPAQEHPDGPIQAQAADDRWNDPGVADLPGGRAFWEEPVGPGALPTLRIQIRPSVIRGGGDGPREVDDGGGYGEREDCEREVKHTNANFDGGEYTAQGGFAEKEIAAASYLLTETEFPARFVASEMIFVTVDSDEETTTQWSLLLFDGDPKDGINIFTVSSDGEIIPHIVIPPGTNGVNVRLEIDPNDSEQIYFENDSATRIISVGYRIDEHNDPPNNPCLEGADTCCNAFPTTDRGGLQKSDGNWLYGLDCGSFGCPANGGWSSFKKLPSYCRPSGDWVLRAFYVPNDCTPTSGACCFGDGSCQPLSPGDCADLGGTYQGDDVNCNDVTCPILSGACCFGDGSCESLTQADCVLFEGTYQGDNKDCGQVNCPILEGACCFEGSGGCLEFPQSVCNDAGGIYKGDNTLCDDIICFPKGACCLYDGSCTDQTSPEDCGSSGGTFQGDKTECKNIECPKPIGSCCASNDFCIDLTEEDCATIGGAWNGGGTTCDEAIILEQPRSASACAGGEVNFSVKACGKKTLQYQWRKDGNNLDGATQRTLKLTGVQPTDAGYYDVIVKTSKNQTFSDAAELKVFGACDSNCDGAADFDDIDLFVVALIDRASWENQASCDYLCANDTNRDGTVDFNDIDAFVDCLIP